jgi:hypothetical protein
MFLAFWSWEKGFKPLIRTTLEFFKCEHMKELNDFVQIGVSVKAD